jgi:O-antigen/teichoic acid export membrane protein
LETSDKTAPLTPEEGGAPGVASALTAGLGRARADGTVTMLVGTLIAGLAAYVWQAAGTRTLGNVKFAPVATIWTLSFLVSTVLLSPIEQFATRTMSAGVDGRIRLARATPAIVRILIGAMVLLSAGCFLARGKFFYGQDGYSLVCAALVICFGLLTYVRGVAAGERDFRLYGRLTGLDGVSRLVLGLIVLAVGGSALAFSWTIPVCALVALFWLKRAPRRTRAHEPGGSDGAPIRMFMATMVGGTAASQVILAGGPLLLALIGAGAHAVTVLFVAQTAGRAALLLALPLWARTLPTLTGIAVRNEHPRLGRLAEVISASSFVLAACASVGAAVVGPPVLAALFGAGSRPPAFVAAAVGAGTALAVGNLGLNQLLVAALRTHLVTISWWAALIVGLLWVAVGPGSELDRVAAAFVLGEAFAMIALALSSSPSRLPERIRVAARRLTGGDGSGTY